MLDDVDALEKDAKPTERTETETSGIIVPEVSPLTDHSVTHTMSERMLSTQQEAVYSEHFRQDLRNQEDQGITAIADKMATSRDKGKGTVALRTKFAAERAQMLEKVTRMNMYKALQSKVEKTIKERDDVKQQAVAAEKKAAFNARNRELQDDLTAKSEAIRRKKEHQALKAMELEMQ